MIILLNLCVDEYSFSIHDNCKRAEKENLSGDPAADGGRGKSRGGEGVRGDGGQGQRGRGEAVPGQLVNYKIGQK